ncbi:unnamed protein product [Paramecium sonneborni]|uniref:RING-type domain-containing protein n=1 Tax=Paramecium sonneborni TaxID=65129 RepID=A0A8S1QEQ8_9CILI|nr:unnamed protein product [Paramecium sonneborni]
MNNQNNQIDDQVVNQKNVRDKTGLPIKRFYSVKINCQICLDQLTQNDEIFRTNCGDTFHKNCINQYIEQNLKERYQELRCPSLHCKEKLSASLLPKLGYTYQQINIYFSAQLEALVIGYPDKFSCCPTLGCQNIFIVNQREQPLFWCEFCDKKYCLRCKSDAHPQFTCEEFQKSKNIENNEREFKKLIENLSCKQCSNCGAWILKSKGCNHMKCKCGYEFCYKCGRKYRAPDCKCPLFDRDNLPQP